VREEGDPTVQKNWSLKIFVLALINSYEQRYPDMAALAVKFDSLDVAVKQQAVAILADAILKQYSVAVPGCAAYLAERAQLIEEIQAKWRLALSFTPSSALYDHSGTKNRQCGLAQGGPSTLPELPKLMVHNGAGTKCSKDGVCDADWCRVRREGLQSHPIDQYKHGWCPLCEALT